MEAQIAQELIQAQQARWSKEQNTQYTPAPFSAGILAPARLDCNLLPTYASMGKVARLQKSNASLLEGPAPVPEALLSHGL